MAASAFVLYNAAKRNMLRGIVDLDTNTLRAYLYKSTSNASTTGLILIGSFTNAVNAAGYTGAKTLGNGTSLVRASGDAAVFDCSNIIFTASAADLTSVMYLVIKASGSGGNQAVCWSKLSAAAFAVSNGNTLTIQFNAAGVFALT